MYDLRRWIAGSACSMAVGFGVWFAIQHTGQASSAEIGILPASAERVNLQGTSDHPMFGGTPNHNMVNPIDTDIPSKFEVGDAIWKSALGSRAYGGPTIANGRIFVGTNNENPRNNRDIDPTNKQPVDKGILMCFEEATGKFLWQSVHDKLPSGQVHDWPREGLCSTPTVVKDRVYYTTNRCTVVCADVDGCTKGAEGAEKQKYKTPTDSKIVWEFDMMKELNVFPHNMSDGSPLIIDDMLFLVTANGVDEGHINIPSPEAPSFIALNKNSGKLVWKSNLPGKHIMHGQWSNPVYGEIGGVKQVIFPGGDGWLYSFKPDTGDLLWKFDANPKDSKYDLGGKGTRSDFIGTPVIHQGKVFIGTGQDPEHFEGIGHYWCIDPTKGGKGVVDLSPELVTDGSVFPPKTKPNPNSAVVWHYGGAEKRANAKRDYVFGRTMSTACIIDDVLYISELAGYLHCLDAKTGKKFWQFDVKSAIWGSAYYVDGKVFIGNEDGDLFVFKHSKQPKDMDEVEIASQIADEKAAGKKLIEVRKAVEKEYLLAKIEIGEPIRSTPVVANGVLYVMTEKNLFAFGKKK
ncbi:PQQ-binding-like beta-propeller repeat protein [Telmatocola sphagniphila]|uniref:PQQ-binding-like beta-propeller repeat protein n=1 Tax=Telmatocola sphagniphila TaxID=1123043 RepID=A0A8E6F0L0_9BACT|nr:PQQ-binding-like beta-propeller repeat protein [Telmatocola sphagniphila]